MGSKTNRSLQRNHEKSLRQKREAGHIEGTKFAFTSNHVKARQLYLLSVTAFVHRRIEPSNPKAETPEDVVMVPYMPKRAPRKVTPAQRAYVNFEPFLIKRA